MDCAGKTPKEHMLDEPERRDQQCPLASTRTTRPSTALQYLTATQGQLAQTQNAINSGLKVATARDNGAIFAIAQNQRGSGCRLYGGHQLPQQRHVLDRRRPVRRPVDFGPADPDEDRRRLSASDSSLDTASRQALNANFTALRDQITTIVKNAVFNGFNLVDGSTTQITALASADGTPPHHDRGAEYEPVGLDRDPDVHGHDLDPDQGFDLGRRPSRPR